MDKIKQWISRVKGSNRFWVILCGAVLFTVLAVYFCCVSCSDKSKSEYTSIDLGSNSDYCSVMRAQVEAIVSQISGVGSAAVVINWDKPSADTRFGSGTSENPKALGALIVCEGGGSTKVKLDVTYAVSTLLDLSIEKIMVYPK